MPRPELVKHTGNPVLTTADVSPSREDLKVDGVFNAAAVRHGSETILLLRVAESPRDLGPDQVATMRAEGGELRSTVLDRSAVTAQGWDLSDSRVVKGPDERGAHVVKGLTSLSHLRLARSSDRVRFRVAEKAFLGPGDELESWGCEDPRMSRVGGRVAITYSGVSPRGVLTKLAFTDDFAEVTRAGVIFAPENRNVGIFSEPVGGMYYAVNRPVPEMIGRPAIWLAESPDLLHWGNQRLLTTVSAGGWEGGRIGAAFAPILTERGWLFVYHAASAENRYCLGAMLLDGEQPWRITARLPYPILEPTEPYETEGFFGDVVFSCGAVVDGDALHLYYGAADEQTALATGSVSDILAALDEDG